MAVPSYIQEILDTLPAAQRDALLAKLAADEAKEATLRQAVVTLRQWAQDAEATTVTAGNNVQVTQVLVNRLGVFFDRFADLLVVLGKGD